MLACKFFDGVSPMQHFTIRSSETVKNNSQRQAVMVCYSSDRTMGDLYQRTRSSRTVGRQNKPLSLKSWSVAQDRHIAQTWLVVLCPVFHMVYGFYIIYEHIDRAEKSTPLELAKQKALHLRTLGWNTCTYVVNK